MFDLDGFSFSSMPQNTWATVGVIVSLLKYNYPGRLNAILVVNTGSAFSILWALLKPLLPKKALTKIKIISRRSTKKVLDEVIGLANVETQYGGDVPSPSFVNDETIIAYRTSQTWEDNL